MFRQTPVIPIFGRYKQKDQGFKASLGYIVSLRLALSVLKKKNKNKHTNNNKNQSPAQVLKLHNIPFFSNGAIFKSKKLCIGYFFFFFTNRVLFV